MIVAFALLLATPLADPAPRTAAVLIDAAKAAEARGDMREAIAETQRAIAAARTAKDGERLARALDMLADYQSAFDVPAAIAAVRERIAVLPAEPAFPRAEAQGKLVVLSMMAGDPTIGVDDLHAAAAAMDRAAKSRAERESSVVAWVMTAQNEFAAGRRDAFDATLTRVAAALPPLEALPGDAGLDLAVAYNNLADLYIRVEDGPRAVATSAKALAALERLKTPTHPDLIDPLGVAGDAERRFGSLDRAGALFRRAVTIADTVGADGLQPAVLGHAYQNLARYYAAIGRADLAIPLLRRGGEVLLAGPAATRQAATDMVGQMRFEASQIAAASGDAAVARSESAAAVALAGQPGASVALKANSLLNDAKLALDAGDIATADARIATVRSIFATAIKPDNPRNGDLAAIEARARLIAGDPRQATDLYDRALAIMASRKASHPQVIVAGIEGAKARLAAGRPAADAVRLARRAADGETATLLEAATQPGFDSLRSADAVYASALDIAWASRSRR